MPDRGRKRRRFLVDDLQYRLLIIHLLYFVVGVLVVAGLLFAPLIGQLRTEDLSQGQRAAVAGELLALHRAFWPAVLVAFVLLTVHSIVVSHRIAGPLYRFRTVLEAVGEGDLSARIRLRRHDYLSDEATAINTMLESLRDRVEEIRAHQARLSELVEETPDGDDGRVRELPAGEIVTEIRGLERCVDDLRLGARDDRAEGQRKTRADAGSAEAEPDGAVGDDVT